jgi:predicted nucleotidyltransferase
MARGEGTEKSDLDFLVEFPDDWSLLDVAHLKVVLEDEFKRTVDVVDYDVIKPRIRESVLRDQVPML